MDPLNQYLAAPGPEQPDTENLTGYFWAYTGPISGHYHDGGSLLIIAANLKTAREAWKEHAKNREDLKDATAVNPHPDMEFQGITTIVTHDNDMPRPKNGAVIITSPDAGCC